MNPWVVYPALLLGGTSIIFVIIFIGKLMEREEGKKRGE